MFDAPKITFFGHTVTNMPGNAGISFVSLQISGGEGTLFTPCINLTLYKPYYSDFRSAYCFNSGSVIFVFEVVILLYQRIIFIILLL